MISDADAERFTDQVNRLAAKLAKTARGQHVDIVMAASMHLILTCLEQMPDEMQRQHARALRSYFQNVADHLAPLQ